MHIHDISGHYTPAARLYTGFDPDQGLPGAFPPDLSNGLTGCPQCFTVATHVSIVKGTIAI